MKIFTFIRFFSVLLQVSDNIWQKKQAFVVFLIQSEQFFLFSPPTASFKVSPLGRGGTTCRNREGLFKEVCGRTQLIPAVRPFPRSNPQGKHAVSRLTMRRKQFPVAIINCFPLWLRIVHRTIRFTRRAPVLRKRQIHQKKRQKINFDKLRKNVWQLFVN